MNRSLFFVGSQWRLVWWVQSNTETMDAGAPLLAASCLLLVALLVLLIVLRLLAAHSSLRSLQSRVVVSGRRNRCGVTVTWRWPCNSVQRGPRLALPVLHVCDA